MVDDNEKIFELTYRAQMTQGFAVQPAIQYVVNPGLNPRVSDALVAGVRFEAALEE